MTVANFEVEDLSDGHIRLTHKGREIHVQASSIGIFIDVYGSANDTDADDSPDASMSYLNTNEKS